MRASKNKVYIATRLEAAQHHKRVAGLLEQLGWKLTYDWTEHGSVQDDGVDRMRAVAESEMSGVSTADLVVVLLPGGRGTHVELGMAAAYDKRIVIHAGTDGDLGERHCAFYHLPQVKTVIGDYADLVATIGGPL